MPFIKPALASPWDGETLFDSGTFVEEKHDGHRLIVEVDTTALGVWSREGRDRSVSLPTSLREALRTLVPGVYDGELIVGGGNSKSYGVTELSNVEQLHFAVFDLLVGEGLDLTVEGYAFSWMQRRELLESFLPAQALAGGRVSPLVFLTWAMPVQTLAEVRGYADRIWAQNGEGLILKDPHGAYRPGKRMGTWRKLKRLANAEVTIIGFEAGLLGPCSSVQLRDDAGNLTACKWKNLELLQQTTIAPEAFIGKRLRIEYTERTPGGGYREPRWDHLVEEA